MSSKKWIEVLTLMKGMNLYSADPISVMKKTAFGKNPVTVSVSSIKRDARVLVNYIDDLGMILWII